MLRKIIIGLTVCLCFFMASGAFAACESKCPEGEWEGFCFTQEQNGEMTITGYAGGESSIDIPEFIKDSLVTRIGDKAFGYCQDLVSITIPASVESIGYAAFYSCTGLTSITIPESVIKIGDWAFTECSSLAFAYFRGHAPGMGEAVFKGCAPEFQVCYTREAKGFTSPEWEGYPAAICADQPPEIGDGPFLAAGPWPVLPASSESPMYLDQNYIVFWTFSDDYVACRTTKLCSHIAEYRAVGGSKWSTLEVGTDPDGTSFAYVKLPVENLQNATTYAFRFAVTDCVGQTTRSGEYYFRVATSDAPPVITGGPYLAAGAWPVLPTSASRAVVLNQDRAVLWTFSDDYASCAGLCTHRARYRRVGDTAWTWLTPVGTDPVGDWYAYTTLPVSSLEAGTYQFYFDVRDCAGQRTSAPKVYYFKVE